MAKLKGPTEDQIQQSIVSWLRLTLPNDAIIHHSVNGGSRGGTAGAIDGARRKAMGMHKGFPDLVIFLDHRTVIFIEVKDAKGKVSPSQRLTQKSLANKGFVHWYVVRSLEEAQKVMRPYLRIKRPEYAVEIPIVGEIT